MLHIQNHCKNWCFSSSCLEVFVHPVILVSGFAGPWPQSQALLQARIAQARSYTADPVTLPFAAEQRLNDLMEEA